MKKALWIWITFGALIVLGVGFAVGAYVGYRHTSITYVRHYSRLYGPVHDEYVILGKYGSWDDIPMVFYGLQQQTNKEICTYWHCVDTLRALSGASLDSYDAWTNWWITEKKQPVPDWHPAFRAVPSKRTIQRDGATNGASPHR